MHQIARNLLCQTLMVNDLIVGIKPGAAFEILAHGQIAKHSLIRRHFPENENHFFKAIKTVMFQIIIIMHHKVS